MAQPSVPPLLTAFGVAAGVIFYGRFYVQWLASELRRKSVIPDLFWYMSSVGSLMLLVYGTLIASPLGTLGQSLNIVIYSRNLVHIWRNRGKLSRTQYWAIHALVAAIVLTAVGLTGYIWLNEYQVTRQKPAAEAAQTWLWLAVGLAGQALFALRFLIQWVATERKRESVVPTVFWYISLVASALQLACFAQRAEWVFAIGMGATMLIYARNLWFIHRGTPPATADA